MRGFPRRQAERREPASAAGTPSSQMLLLLEQNGLPDNDNRVQQVSSKINTSAPKADKSVLLKHVEIGRRHLI
jgi:hypothetical protein